MITISKKGIEFLTLVEGKRGKVYYDVCGLPTIGVGHLLTHTELMTGKVFIPPKYIRYENGLSELEINTLLMRDLHNIEQCVNAVNCPVPMQQCQYDALCSFVFNVGSKAFKQSKLKLCLSLGQYDKVPEQLKRWIYAGGKIITGLINRRNQEIELFTGKY